MGAALLDIEHPERVLGRLSSPVFEPQAAYEVEGPVGNVVFGTGLLDRDHQWWLYYGAGDGVIGVATVQKSDLLSQLLE
jgi:predicted GH43/DUF377 family glycosyl hydrolase